MTSLIYAAERFQGLGHRCVTAPTSETVLFFPRRTYLWMVGCFIKSSSFLSPVCPIASTNLIYHEVGVSGELCGKQCDHESFWYCVFRVVETICMFGISTVLLHSTAEKKERTVWAIIAWFLELNWILWCVGFWSQSIW